MKNGVHPLWLKTTVLVFAGALMTAFVLVRGHHDGRTSATATSAYTQVPVLVDSPVVMKLDTNGQMHLALPAQHVSIAPNGERAAPERAFFGSSKSLTPIIPTHQDPVMEATERTWKQWNDSVNRAEAMQTLVVDRYGAYPPGMITVDSLQRRVDRKRQLLSGNKAPMSTWRVEADMKYLDSLLNALIRP